MANKMLIDATHPEETRVVALRGNRVEEFDFESAHRKQLRGNIYLAKVTRVEPSLQAAFVDYGGNRHGFLAFSEIHPDYYQIPIADRQALIAEEERAQRAAAEEVDRAPRHRRHAAVAREDEVMRGEAVEAPLDMQEAEQPSAAADQPPATSEESDGEALSGPLAEQSLAPPSDISALESSEEDAGDASAIGSESDLVHEVSAEAEIEAGSGPSEPDEAAALSPVIGEGTESGERAVPAQRRSAENGIEDEEVVESVGGADALEEVPDRAPRYRRQYKIQEVIKRRQVMLVQVVKEERGTKGAALTT